MFNLASRLFLFVYLFIFSQLAAAVMVEAQGQAIISNGDISAARQAAIRDASQQASMQAAVYVSSSQVVRDGILEIDNMQISTLGQVSNIKIIDEKVVGQTLFVHIKADVLIDEGCSNGVSNSYRKSVAMTAFPLQHLQQSNLGGLYNISSELPAQLAQQLNSGSPVSALNAGRISIHPNPQLAPVTQLDDGSLSNLFSEAGQMEVNYIVSGVIRDITMVDPRTHAENNFFIDLYNRLDYKSRKHLRNFTLDLYIHDGFSGHLIWQNRYQTAGLWSLDPTIKTGFATPGFMKQDYGQKVSALQKQMADDLNQALRCEPFTARIIRTQDRDIWINAGSQQGLKRGDKLTIYRKSTFYAPDMKANSSLDNTRQTLVIDDVQVSTASGKISGTTESYNIRPGDLAIAR
ncbi:flagellar assembly protein T N-terminal domain-containing protein [Neptuniibacter halophilus]|uniref:flagellar assembly protein T N-terminal domain-containing protein n=1 Tax=Neptuniibacter halophilus TaxID=651666 RepID=UPI0025738105|nr:flagellar assembly protein T N-terminal domain-containing protein [Neptuniibacter halophilus]